jgi:predicted Zn-dependent protease
MRLLFSILALWLLLGSVSSAQTNDPSSPNPWTFKAESQIAQKKQTRDVVPNVYRTVRLDLAAIKSLLKAVPLWHTADAQTKNVELAFPMPDGSFQRFKIVKAPIMHPDLAKKYPEIQSFAGYGIEDPAAYLRFDLTPMGFHAMMLNAATGHVFIDPYAREDNEHYVVYFKKDFYVDKPWQCSGEPVEGKHEPLPSASYEKAGDCKLRTYSLALACTGEYAAFHGGTVSSVLSAMNTTMTRVNGVYERDLSITMQLVANNDLLVFTNANTDPYNNFDATAMLAQNRTTCDNVIGTANYDIGHVFSTGGGGLAYVKCICNATYKAGGVTGTTTPVGDPFDIDYVCHEMGHQFGANHTQNNPCSSNSTSSVEPGSGSTIMGYAGVCAPNIQAHSDAYFHAMSIQEIMAHVSGTGSGNACATLSTINNFPTFTAIADFAVPKSTPFLLTGNGADTDAGDVLTYCWEQMDNAAATMPPVPTSTVGPAFKSMPPTTSPIRYFPNLTAIINNTTPTWEVLPSVARTLNFRLTVRDNHLGGGCTKEDNIVVTVASSGPFVVTAPNTAVSWPALSSQTVTWDVANTTATPVSAANVDILLSTDGGLTYPITLLSATPNDGTQVVTIPNNQTSQARIMVRGTGKIFFDISNVNFTIGAPLPDFTVDATPNPQAVCRGGSSTVTVNVGSLSNFNGSVALAVTGLPLGVTASFSPSTVTAPGVASLVLTSTTSTTMGNYNITVSGTGTTGTKTKVTAISVVTTPAQAVQSAPATGITGVSLTPTLSWAAVAGATSYEVQIANNSNFTNPIVNATGITAISYTVSPALPDFTQLFWRVRAVNSCGAGAYSTTRSFTTLIVNDFTVDAAPSSQAICRGGSTTITVNVGKIANFNGNVTLSVTGLPSGVTASFSTTTVAVPGSATLTLNATTSTTVGNYNITVSGVGSTGTKTRVVVLSVVTTPAQTVQSAPATGLTGASLTPTLSWTAVTGATSYEVQIANNTAFTNPIVNATGITTLSYTSTTLPASTLLYWRVRALNSCGTGVYSASRTFTTLAFNPKFEYGTLTNVSEQWQTVNLSNTYTSMVVVASVVVTSNASLSIVTRIQNATGNSFQVKLQVAGNATGATGTATVYYMVAEEGTYTLAANGIKFEAKKHLSTKTSRFSSSTSTWVYEPKTHSNTYTTPVIVGQVMTYNDPNWSVFWSSKNAGMTSPATASATSIGKHIGEDNVNLTRANETLGYMVFESGTGTINGKRYAAAIGADAVKGVPDNAAGYSYALSGFANVEGVAVSSAGQDATEGAWAVLATGAPLTTTSLKTWAMEDNIPDSERTHTTDQVCYIVIGTGAALTTEETDDRETVEQGGEKTEETTSPQILAYPNPFTTELTIQFEQTAEDAPVAIIYDAFGRVVSRAVLPKGLPGQRVEKINLEGLNGFGCFFLQLLDGTTQHNLKLVRIE